MKELLTYIVQSLSDTHSGSVTELKADGETVNEVRVADGDMGKVIGRQGRIANNIRILTRAVAQRKGKKVSLKSVTLRRYNPAVTVRAAAAGFFISGCGT
ncbi:MAG: KH domain-containing protein [Oscillospiraceae bacterium]